MFGPGMSIDGFDPRLAEAIAAERRRQEEHLELIASENYASPRVLEAQGSVLTNKYAEGYPGKRYYGGCEYVDVVEELAIERAKQLFGAAYANVQPHSGSQANAAVYFALLAPGRHAPRHEPRPRRSPDPRREGELLRQALQRRSSTASTPRPARSTTAQVERLAREHRPKMIIAGFSAYSRVIDWQRFRAIADAVGAYFVVDMAHVAGLVAAGVYPNPVPLADVVTTTTHKTLRGPRGGLILAREHPEPAQEAQLASCFPGMQGGPLMHVIAAKAVALLEALAAGVQGVPAAGGRERARDGEVAAGSRLPHRLRRHGQSPVPARPHRPGLHRQGRRRGARPRAHHGQQERRAERPAAAVRDQRPAHRHAGDHDPRVQGSGSRARSASWIADVLDAMGDEAAVLRVREAVKSICGRFPVYA